MSFLERREAAGQTPNEVYNSRGCYCAGPQELLKLGALPLLLGRLVFRKDDGPVQFRVEAPMLDIVFWDDPALVMQLGGSIPISSSMYR